MGLRDGLSEFGAIEVDVNPGQVVTAYQAKAMNKASIKRFKKLQIGLSQGNNRIRVKLLI